MRFDQEDRRTLAEIMRWRRDVRHFRPDPVASELLARLAQAMDMAPSVGNARPWRVRQVVTPALRARLVELFEAENATAAEGYRGAQRTLYAGLKLAGLREAPVVLCVFTETEPDAGAGLGRRTMPETLCYSTIGAIHALWLAARAENIGLGWVSILAPRAVERALAVPRSWRLTACLCLGYAERDDDRPLLDRKGWQADAPTDWRIV